MAVFPGSVISYATNPTATEATSAVIGTFTHSGFHTSNNDEIEAIETWLDGNVRYKNLLINGNFDIWQRNNTFTNPATATYLADRWFNAFSLDGGTDPTTIVYSRQQQTSGDLFGSQFFFRIAPNGAGSTYGNSAQNGIFQRIENGVSRYCGAGKYITVSFYAKSSISGKRLGIGLKQKYGTGGSPSSDDILNASSNGIVTLTSSWARYTATFPCTTLVGKTFGTGLDDNLQLGIYQVWGTTAATLLFGGGTAETYGASGNIDIAQVQIEMGQGASSFVPVPFGEELQRCKRYYEKSYDYYTYPGASDTAPHISEDHDNGAVQQFIRFQWEVEKRVSPTFHSYDTAGTIDKISYHASYNSAWTANQAATSAYVEPKGGYVYLNSPTSTGIGFNYTAEAEL